MKTTTTLLLSLMVLTGSITTAQAENERTSRVVKTSTPTRVASTNNNRANNKTQVKIESSRSKSESKPSVRTAQIKVERSNDQARTKTDVRVERSDNRSNNSVQIRVENERSRITGRPVNRTTQVTYRDNKPQYREYRHRCVYCSGRGFTLHFNGLRHIGCTHCNGLGHFILKELYLNTLAQSGQYSMTQMARIETDQLDAVLQLSRKQWDKVYRINYRYLVRNEGRRYYPYSEKVEDIQDVLNNRQNLEYAYYLEELQQDNYAFELHY